MRRILFLCLIIATTLRSSEPPFSRGVNVTGWFQESNAHAIQFTKFTREDLADIKSLGCDVIRLPINLHSMTSGAPDYTIDPLFYYFLDQVVNWAEELELHLILDNHTFDPAVNTDPNIDEALLPVWTQMAEHYKDRSTLIYYEILNEPHGISDEKWNSIQHKVVEAIREVDSVHTIIIGPAGWNSYNNLSEMDEYDDDNLIYTFHFYDPFLFTHQGASWSDPSLVPLSGVPFPYKAEEMPELPAELDNTWVEGAFNGYKNTGTVAYVKQLIDIAAAFKNNHNVPLYCGEFGVYKPNSSNLDRIFWYYVVRSYLEQKDIAWTIWDYKGGFGLFEKGTSELFDYDLNTDLLKALGLQVPPQQEFIMEPDTTAFNLYKDYIGQNIVESSWISGGILDYYNSSDPFQGKYCIHWAEVDQYCNIGFDFQPNKDLTELVDRGYAVEFWVKGDTPDKKFDIRFVDTKTDEPGDHPWRMRYVIDESITVWDNEWHQIQIPLKEFFEHGSWDNGWYDPQGEFSWAETDRFEIVSEHSDLKGVHFYFDNIMVTDTSQTGDIELFQPVPEVILYQNYPNPFNPKTKICFYLPEKKTVDIYVYDLLGRKVDMIIENTVLSGYQEITWNASGLSSGVYFCQLTTEERTEMIKLLVQR
ncbi:MAG: cellulase family glycosylhydrolase [bacterium]